MISPGEEKDIGNPDVVVPDVKLGGDGRKRGRDDCALESGQYSGDRQAYDDHPELEPAAGFGGGLLAIFQESIIRGLCPCLRSLRRGFCMACCTAGLSRRGVCCRHDFSALEEKSFYPLCQCRTSSNGLCRFTCRLAKRKESHHLSATRRVACAHWNVTKWPTLREVADCRRSGRTVPTVTEIEVGECLYEPDSDSYIYQYLALAWQYRCVTLAFAAE